MKIHLIAGPLDGTSMDVPELFPYIHFPRLTVKEAPQQALDVPITIAKEPATTEDRYIYLRPSTWDDGSHLYIYNPNGMPLRMHSP